MAAPRKTFRIEETAAMRPVRAGRGDSQASHRHAELMQALGALRAAVAPPAALHNGQASEAALPAVDLPRIVDELTAVVADSAQATQKVLAAAEQIDQLADNLSAALKARIERGTAQDIREHIIGIFEACNFQDLAGQRVGKVIAMLKASGRPAVPRPADGAASRNTIAPGPSDVPLHGPRLPADRGHITQAEIDALFGC